MYENQNSKFSYKISKDSIVKENGKVQLENWRNVPNLTLLNLKYDVTPTKFIS